MYCLEKWCHLERVITPRGSRWSNPLCREPAPIKRPVLYASPLVTTALFYDVTLSAEELWAVLSPLMCVGHLNLNLCVYEPQTASPSSAFAPHYQLSLTHKSPAPLAVLGTGCWASARGPPAKWLTPMLSVRTSRWESVDKYVFVCVYIYMDLFRTASFSKLNAIWL